MDNQNIVPIILGGDLNCYNIARAFHEEYGIKSYAYGRYAIGVTKYSKLINFHIVDKIDTPDVMLSTLEKAAKEHEGKKLILFGCTDAYVNLISEYKDKLKDKFIIPYPDYGLSEDITQKANFYGYCEKYGIPYPKTYVLEKGDELPDEEKLGFEYPIIIKPSSSRLYWDNPFDTMKKVYRASNREEALGIIKDIYSGGYPDKVILQDTIPLGDSNMYVLTAYSGEDAKVRMMCLGHVLLEEHTPHGLGNHCAVITEQNEELMKVFKTFLEETGYTGFANFDIKLDCRDGVYKCFEINARQGRSNYYLTASGNNVARLVVEDRIYGKKGECVFNKNEAYWRYIPDSVVFKYTEDQELKNRIKRLIKEKKAKSLVYPYDMKFNPKRALFLLIHTNRHKKKFKIYYEPTLHK